MKKIVLFYFEIFNYFLLILRDFFAYKKNLIKSLNYLKKF